MAIFTLTLVRHGETEANKDRIIQGQTDTELSERGLRQAELAGERLQLENFTHIYTSDLKRAYKTCEIIVEKNQFCCTIVKDARLRERKFGMFEGRPSGEFRAAYRKDRNRVADYAPPGGENLKQTRARAVEFINEVCDKLRQQMMADAETNNDPGLVKRRRHTGSLSSEVFSNTATDSDARTDSESNITSQQRPQQLNPEDAEEEEDEEDDEGGDQRRNQQLERENRNVQDAAVIQSGGAAGAKATPNTTHSNSGSTSSTTSGFESLTTASNSLEHLVTEPSVLVADGGASDVSQSQGSSCSSLGESLSPGPLGQDSDPGRGGWPLILDSDIHTAIIPPKTAQDGCPNVSLSPIFEHRLTSLSSTSSGRNSSFDEGDGVPALIAEVLVVSHGGLIQQIISHLVEDWDCKLPGEKKHAMHVSPNTGISKFVISLETNDERPRVTCLTIHDECHLTAANLESLKKREEA